MAKRNNHKNRKGIVYSTNDSFEYDEYGEESEETLEPSAQKLIVSIDKKNRKGKPVTLVEGYIGDEIDLKELGKLLKTKCGVGGSAKDGEIIIQGEFKEKVATLLSEQGYGVKKR